MTWNYTTARPSTWLLARAYYLALLLVCVSTVMSSPQNTPINESSESIVVHSGFDSGDEGWKVVDVPDNGPYDQISNPIVPTYHTDMGTSGGCVSSTDPNGVTFYWQAPEAFLGNKLAAYGGALTFDLRTEGSALWQDADVVLIGGGTVLVYDIPTDPTSEWANYRVPFSEGGWKVGSLLGTTATANDLRYVLSDLTTLLIRGEYWWGGDNCFLDNVSMLQDDLLSALDLTVDPGANFKGELTGITLNYNLTGPQTYDGTISLDISGNARISALQPGTYSLSLTSSHWLKRVIAGIQVGSVNTVNTTLINGDADGDGQINLFDMVVLDSSFGSANNMADLDGDSQVNLFDYVIIDMNFGAQAD
ncbi:MAG: laminin B domain-containing protein [Armatimonadota bacterium]